MIMLKNLLKVSLLVIVLMASACKKEKEEDPKEWARGSDFEGIRRSGATSFVINGKIYITGGFDGEKRLNDLWTYNEEKSNWVRVKNDKAEDVVFPGKARNYAVSFTVNGKAYVGSGFDGKDALSDFYEYDPLLKTWKKVAADFPGEARYGGVAFAANGLGVVGTGTNKTGDLVDFYTYNPQADQWKKVSSLPSSKRSNAFTFTIGETVYIGGGLNNGSYLSDFWKYSVKDDSWVRLNDLNRPKKPYEYNLSRQFASTFVIGNSGYLIGGSSGQLLSSVWKYRADTDDWKQYEDFKGAAREAAIGFAIGNQGFITTGRNGSTLFDDTWIFTPSK